MKIDFSEWRADNNRGGLIDENLVLRVTCRHVYAVPLLAAAQDGQRLREALLPFAEKGLRIVRNAKSSLAETFYADIPVSAWRKAAEVAGLLPEATEAKGVESDDA